MGLSSVSNVRDIFVSSRAVNVCLEKEAFEYLPLSACMKSRNYLITVVEIGSENTSEDGGGALVAEGSGLGGLDAVRLF